MDHKNNVKNVSGIFEVFATVVLKAEFSRFMTSFSLVNGYQCFD